MAGVELNTLPEFQQLVANALALEPTAVLSVAKVYRVSVPLPALKDACALELGLLGSPQARMAAWVLPGDFVLERAQAIYLKLLNSSSAYPDTDVSNVLKALKDLQSLLGGDNLAGVMFLSRTGKDGAWERTAPTGLPSIRALRPVVVTAKPTAGAVRPVVVTVKPSMASHVRRFDAGAPPRPQAVETREPAAPERSSIQSIRFLDASHREAKPEAVPQPLEAPAAVSPGATARPGLTAVPSPPPSRPRGVSRIEMGQPIELTQPVLSGAVREPPTTDLTDKAPSDSVSLPESVAGLDPIRTASEAVAQAGEPLSARVEELGTPTAPVLESTPRSSLPAMVPAEGPVLNEVSFMPARAQHRKTARSAVASQSSVVEIEPVTSARALLAQGLPEPSFVSRSPIKRRGRPIKSGAQAPTVHRVPPAVSKTPTRSVKKRTGPAAASSSTAAPSMDSVLPPALKGDTRLPTLLELGSLPDEPTALFLKLAERFLGNRQRLAWTESRDANYEPFVDILTHTKHSGVVLLVHGVANGGIEGAAFFVQVKGTGIMRAQLFKQVQALINQRALEGAAYQLKGSKFARPKAALAIRAVRSALSALYDERGATQEFFPKTSRSSSPAPGTQGSKRRTGKTTTTISFVETTKIDPEIVEFYNSALVSRLGLKHLRVRMATPPLNLDLLVCAGPALLVRRGSGAAHKPFEKKLKNPTWSETLRAIEESIKASTDKKSVFLEAIEVSKNRIEFQLQR
jgi:hypothetical protein